MSEAPSHGVPVPPTARLIAIDGPGGSGKSTLARMLATDDGEGTVIVEMDDFHRPVPRRRRPPAAPGDDYALDRLAAQVLAPLRAGEPARYQRYDWDADAMAEWRIVPATARVIVEGVYSTSLTLRGCFDLRIWIDAPYRVRLARGLARDGEPMRGRWVDEWMPAEEEYVRLQAPQAAADLVLDGAGSGAGGTATFTVVENRLPR